MIDAVVARVWPDGVEAVEPLGGGITNRNFKVLVGGEAFVVRIGGADTHLLGIDRGVEHAASRAAAALGIGPPVVAFVDGCLVTRFVPGEHGGVEPAAAASLLRRLHAAPPIPGRFDPFRVVEAYEAIARDRGIPLPPAYERAKEVARRVEAARAVSRLCPCHNDLLASNFVRDVDRTWLVDWEYAGMGDPAFDLANFAVSNDLDEDGDRALLDAYGGADADLHVLLRFVSDLREAMWGVVQQALSELDFDFVAYADEHFERLERAAAEPRFRRALDAASTSERQTPPRAG